MARYSYTARSEPTKTVQGIIEAQSEQEAVSRLTKMGYFPIAVKVEGLSLTQQEFWHFQNVSHREIVIFTHQLSSLIESGINIINSLNIILNQTTNRFLRSILNNVITKIKDGKPLSESLAIYPDIFSSLYTSMVRLGESGGNIEQSLKRLASFLEKDEEFKNSIRSALIYPAFIFSVSILTIVVLLGFVIPRLVSMFQDIGQILPLPTKILINASSFLRHYWWLILSAICIFIFIYKRISLQPQARFSLHEFKLKIPVVGSIVLKTDISRVMRTLSLLLSSGLTIIYSLEISATVIENEVIKQEIQKFKTRISEGLSFSKCLVESKYFPSFVTNIVNIGEETGTLEKSLMRIADDYERDVDRVLKVFTQLLEPVIILTMGLVVGFIVLAMMLPIFQINLIVK